MDFPEIYYIGNEKAAKHNGDLDNESGNFGYDDERGDYSIVNGDHLSYRYEIIDVLGKRQFWAGCSMHRSQDRRSSGH